ncbi:hypothetical protein AWB74_06571 [Caballeronia arvi]|uniref:DUF4411 family protein n=1 Tax=Caballeronia arvi TaxID=1777135 RepID=A0A158KQS2_9BURK|nr:DUF4411 family protein [Caballeronia arvi]SAL83345.1 hypothetical protein AWB74_06571 [Caballeronia arvi]
MYLLDTNIFIEAQNRYYANDICPGFWHWLDDANERGLVASISEVYEELVRGSDALSDWTKARQGSGWFLDVTDDETQSLFAEVIQHIESIERYTRPNKDKFIGGADPWLIAKARTMGWNIATHEEFSENSKMVKIPNVCRDFGVSTRSTFDVLRELRASFAWAKAA